jgi:hypothetical protein
MPIRPSVLVTRSNLVVALVFAALLPACGGGGGAGASGGAGGSAGSGGSKGGAGAGGAAGTGGASAGGAGAGGSGSGGASAGGASGSGGAPAGSGGAGAGGAGAMPDAGIATDVPCGMAGGVQYVERYRSDRSRFCVHPVIWTAHEADVKKFFAFGDFVVGELQNLFGVTPKDLPFTIQVEQVSGGAHTGSDFGPGVGVTGDAYYNDLGGVKGFWGYLLTMHELINVWTGMVSEGWPTDWWADHRSPFPNSMDYQIMLASGMRLDDDNLIKAAGIQHERLGVMGKGDFDSEVKLFDDFFTQFGGFPTFARIFKLIQADGVKWTGVAKNPSPLLSAYVIAYVSLGFQTKQDLTATFTAAGVGSKDPQTPAYTVDATMVGDVADAHCAIAAATADVTAARAALRKGDYKTAKVKAACGAKCPAECGCDQAADQCVALWRAK